MKQICVSMNLNEQVLNSYLVRVFNGRLVEKKTCKTIYISEENITWPVWKFKGFCFNTLHIKNPFRIYKAKVDFKTEIHSVSVVSRGVVSL